MRAIIGIAGTAFLIGSIANVAGSDVPAERREFTVPESAGPGEVIGRLNGDPEAAKQPSGAAFSIAHDGRQIPFLIDARTGELTLADSSLDHEARSQHEFTVRLRRPRALDPARRAYLADLLASGVDPETIDELLFEVALQTVVVNVADTPEAPVLSSAAASLVINDAEAAASDPLVAHDPDAGDTLTFELIAADSEQFQIDPRTGVLTRLADVPVVAGSFPVTVRVTDSTGLSDAATYNVEVVVAPPAVVADLPAVLPEATAPTPEPVEAVAIVPQPAIDDAGSADPASESVIPAPGIVIVDGDVIEPEPDVEPEPAVEPEPQVAVAELTETIATPPVVAPEPTSAAQMEETGPAVAAPPPSGFARGLPLLFVLAAAGVAGAWYLRRRSRRTDAVLPGPFRVVREAQTPAENSMVSPGETLPNELADLTESRIASLVTDAADQAELRELIASAFQQASVQAAPSAPTSPTAEPEAPVGIVESVAAVTDEPYVDAASAADVVADELQPSAAYAVPAELPLDEQAYEPVGDVAELNEQLEETEPGYGTEPYAMPAPLADDVVESLPADVDAEFAAAAGAADPIPTMYGYGSEEEELAGGYSGLRLSHASDPQSFGDLPADDAGAYAGSDDPGESALSDESSEDPKLQELRRQLSDLFGVPADRSRTSLAPTLDLEDGEFAAAEEMVVEDVPEPAPEPVATPMAAAAAVAPPPMTAPAAPAAPAPASDPVNSWLEYLKQRALEKPGSPPTQYVPASAPQAPVSPTPASTPVPTPVVAAQRSNAPPPVRVNKSAVREEIALLRNVANLHSRNVLARRALNQRARITWVLWGTALVVLCFSGLWSVRHDAGGIRTLGWLLLGGAAVALACCVYGFRQLTHRPAAADDESGQGEPAAIDDLEATIAPDLMTPEMEQRLRQVLEEARNVPVTSQSR